MGLVNTLHADFLDPETGQTRLVHLQFKYGATREYDYRIGDKLKWGHNERGVPGKKRVVVRAVNVEDWEPEIWFLTLEKDVIASIEPNDGKHDFVKTRSNFIILED